METWVLKKIRAVSFRRVIAWGATLVGGVLLFTSNQRYIENFLNGPYTLGAAELDAIDDVATTPRYFARVTGSRVIDTGLREYSVRSSGGVETGRSEAGAYYALVVGEKFLIFKSRGNATSNVAQGRLVPWTSELESEMFDSKEMKELRPRFYPFYVQNGSFRVFGYWMIVGAIVFVALLAWKGRPAWRHWRDPAAHPLVARMAPWGDPLGVAVLAEREAENPRFKAGGWALGDTYLVQSTTFTFDVLRVRDLLWAYKKITKHSVNFIPTGRSYEAILTCYGGRAVVKAKEKVVDAILTFAHQRAPWAVIGYSDELAGLFNKQQAEFVAAVEQRRAEAQRK
ncbi:MAG TPA: DUF6709 family protein [Gemmatimonadales bacterium]|jgi:hypothetical protein|nr:DUF6709 family protein [Gemmatimonadales bacterium]